MTTFTAKHFDVLDFVEKSKALGVDEKVATYQARAIEQAIDIAISQSNDKDVATKQDIALAIAHLKNELIKWILGTGMSALILLSGMLAKGFHWF